MITWDQVVAMALRLPGCVLSTSYGRPAVKLRDKTFACTGKEHDHFVLMVESDEAEALMEQQPRMFFRTPHYAHSRAVLVRFRPADKGLVESLLQRGWSRHATKAQRAALDRSDRAAAAEPARRR